MDDKQRRAERAKQLLEHDLLIEAFGAMEKACYNSIMHSKHDDQGAREAAYYFGRCIEVFKASLQKIMNDGVDTFEMPENIKQLKRR